MSLCRRYGSLNDLIELTYVHYSLRKKNNNLINLLKGIVASVADELSVFI
jgi:hypothetical protein